MERFVVVGWYCGIPYILQYRGVMDWFFYNNNVKLFKTKKAAIKNAYKVSAMYKLDCVKVYSVTDNEGVCGDYIRKWEREESEKRVVFELNKK